MIGSALRREAREAESDPASVGDEELAFATITRNEASLDLDRQWIVSEARK
jgi:hypothetical protein